MLDELIRREFNRWAEQGRGRGIERHAWGVTRQLIELMNPGHHGNFVDLGCGVGWATRVLAEKADRGLVLGVDLSDRMIHQARTAYRNPPNTFFIVAEAARTPFRDGFFDGLLSIDSVYYYPNLEGSFSEVFRILGSKGKAFFLLNYYKENVHSHVWAQHIDIPVHLLSGADYTSMLAKAGFAHVSHRRIIDSSPLPEDWTPTAWFPTRQDHMKFRAEGALLLEAAK